MTTTCQQMDALLAERASGELAPDDAARLDGHLDACERCRSELRTYQELFAMARPATPEPRVAELDVSTFSAYQRRRRRRVTSLTLGAGLVAAVVAASVVIAPAFLTLRSLPRHQAPHVATSEVTSDASAGMASQTAGSQEWVASNTSDAVDPEDAALAAFDEVDAF